MPAAPCLEVGVDTSVPPVRDGTRAPGKMDAMDAQKDTDTTTARDKSGSGIPHREESTDRDGTTTREMFRELAAEHRVVPVVRKVLADSETPLSAYRKLGGDRPGTFLLESAENGRSWSRWSFIGAGSPSALTVVDGEAAWMGETPVGAPSGGHPLDALGATIELLRSERLPDLPPLTGGMVGYQIGRAHV